MLTLPYPPSSNRYWRLNNGHLHRSREALYYCEQVGWLCLEAGINKPISDDVVVEIRVFRPRKSGDLDNRIKILLDALEGYAYDNDSQIVGIHATRHDDKDNPRAEVYIWGGTGDTTQARIDAQLQADGWPADGEAKDVA